MRDGKLIRTTIKGQLSLTHCIYTHTPQRNTLELLHRPCTSPTLLLVVFVTFKSCAAVIRASSCVSLSNLFSASSISVFPISFFRYFTANGFVSENLFVDEMLTYSALFDFFCCNPNKVEDLDHYGRNYVHHSLIWCHFGVYFQTSEK